MKKLQGIQRLAIYASTKCILQLIEQKSIEYPHRAIISPSVSTKLSAKYNQIMIDGIKVKWPDPFQKNPVKMTTAQFFEYPIPAYKSQQENETCIEISNKFESKKIWKRYKLRNPLDFESTQSFLTDLDSEEKFQEVQVQGPLNSTDFEWISRSIDVENIYRMLLRDDTFDSQAFYKVEQSSIKKTGLETHSMVQNISKEIALGFQSLNDKLEEDYIKKGEIIWFNVQEPIEGFFERKDFLPKLDQKIEAILEGDSDSVLSHIKIICGLGGIGKTEMVRKYIQVYKSKYENVIWINAESVTSMDTSFSKLARHLGLRLKDSDQDQSRSIEDIVKECYQLICLKPSLIVFDNAEFYQDCRFLNQSGIKPYLPWSLPKNLLTPIILITSRNHDWLSLAHQTISLELLDDTECVQFVRQELQLPQEEEADASKLGLMLGGLILALQQAIAYIRQENEDRKFQPSFAFACKRFGVLDYLEEFEEKSKLLLNYKPLDSDYDRTVLTTWRITLDRISQAETGKCNKKMSELLAFLSPHSIPMQFIFQIWWPANGKSNGDRQDEMKFSSCLRLLHRYALIKISEDSHSISMHRLVQLVILETLKEERKVGETLDEFIQPCNKILACLGFNYEISSQVLGNIQSIIDKSDLAPPPIKMELLEFLYAVAVRYQKMGRYCQSLEMLEKLLKKQESILDKDDPNVMQTKHKICRLLDLQCRFDEALKLGEKLLEQRNKILGPDDVRTLKTRCNLAYIFYKQDQVEQAMEILYEVHEIQKRVLAKDDKFFVETQQNMAVLLRRQGRLEEAMELYEKVYSIWKIKFNPEEPSLIAVQHNMASLLQYQGRREEALQGYQSILEVQKKHLSHDHPALLRTMQCIGVVLAEQQKFDQAMEMYQKVFEVKQKTFDKSNPDLIATRRGMADILRAQGNHQQSFEIYKEIYQVLQMNPRVSRILMLEVEIEMVEILRLLGQLKEAIELTEQIYQKNLETFGVGDRRTMGAWRHIVMMKEQLRMKIGDSQVDIQQVGEGES